MFLHSPRVNALIYRRLRIGASVHAPKKRAKVLLFFDMTKYFLKKMQKKFISGEKCIFFLAHMKKNHYFCGVKFGIVSIHYMFNFNF